MFNENFWQYVFNSIEQNPNSKIHIACRELVPDFDCNADDVFIMNIFFASAMNSIVVHYEFSEEDILNTKLTASERDSIDELMNRIHIYDKIVFETLDCLSGQPTNYEVSCMLERELCKKLIHPAIVDSWGELVEEISLNPLVTTKVVKGKKEYRYEYDSKQKKFSMRANDKHIAFVGYEDYEAAVCNYRYKGNLLNEGYGTRKVYVDNGFPLVRTKFDTARGMNIE